MNYIVSYEQCFTSLLFFCLANWRKGLAENHRQFPDRLFVLEFARPMETVTSAACHSHHAASLMTTLDPSSLCYLFIYTVIGNFQVRWAIKSQPWGFWSVCFKNSVKQTVLQLDKMSIYLYVITENVIKYLTVRYLNWIIIRYEIFVSSF